MYFYLDGTAIRAYYTAGPITQVFYLDGTAVILQEWTAADNTGTLFFSNWW